MVASGGDHESAGSERRSRACAALAEQRSALVDGALDDADRERVLNHLVGCPACRAEVAELRRLRRLLNLESSPDTPPPSYDLANRLVAIAGTDAQEPLLAAPFRRTGHGPYRRRRRRTARLAAAAGSVGAGAVLVVAVGLSAAPPVASTIADPTTSAQAEFSALAAQEPLADSAGSVAMSNGQTLGAAFTVTPPAIFGPSGDIGVVRELNEAEALAQLRRSAAAAGEVSYRGTQSFQVLSDGRVLGSLYTVETRSGGGREVAVLDASGRQLLSTISTDTTARAVDSDELSLLADNYLLIGSRWVDVAGRQATVVSAIGPSGQTAARWWLDAESGLLLWHETYDEHGRTTLSSGFTSVSIGEPDSIADVSKKATVSLTTTSRTLASSADLRADGWSCPDVLGGLSLVRIRTDSAGTPSVLHLGYSDGLSSVSVFEQHGLLGHAPAGTRWDGSLRAYVRGGAAKVASWTSGDTVFTVVTDGSADLLADTVAALPHDPSSPQTTIDRVRAGWSRILESVTG
ncbi:zf-HC2 domain-containing protein [Microlunatus ginsengisoli]|uniref:Putative zinc-finger domain-containing protein n=1 Tax=Microlunatus ginsengisoli TaxID=363863 RepID=A0ABP6ZRN2_9ACTN